MTQQSGNQFDDDLTVGLDDDEDFSTDSIDLFEFSGGEESPIARLKTIILSIDWEINDEILQQLDDELVDLADIWADDKIKLVYIQGLSKIGKYIDKEKAASHPNSIKLLITFYHNLEKIVSEENVMSDAEKKELLTVDVKKFNQLKSQIGTSSTFTDSPEIETAAPAAFSGIDSDGDQEDELKILKAQVLGLDWEISDSELEKLGIEIKRLESIYSDSNGKRILLQGIGALSSYIKKMKSQSNSKAFSLLRSFYDVLEKTPSGHLPPGEEKQRLLSEVEKFKSFKAEIANIQSEPAPEPVVNLVEPTHDAAPEQNKEVLPEEDEDSEQVESDVEARLASVFGDIDDDNGDLSTEKDIALEGVNVETAADDDSDEKALPFAGGVVAPALAEVDEESSFSVEKLAGDLAEPTHDVALEQNKEVLPEEDEDSEQVESDVEARLASVFGNIDDDNGDLSTEKDIALEGVNVETAADDDSDEEALPFAGGVVAPALAEVDEESSFSVEKLVGDLAKSVEPEAQVEAESIEEEIIPGVDVESDADDDSEEEALPVVDGEIAPALSSSSDESGFDVESQRFAVDDSDADDLDNRLGSFFDDEVESSSKAWGSEQEEESDFVDDNQVAALSDVTDDFDEVVVEPEESEEIDTDFLDDGAPVPALSDAEESSSSLDISIEDTVEEKLSFFEDDVDMLELEESDEDSDAPQLSFLDEDFAESADLEEIFEDDVATDDEVSSFFNDDAPAPALSDNDNEDSPFEEEALDDVVDEKLSFLDDEKSSAPVLSTDVEDTIVESPLEETEEEAFLADEEDIEEVAFEDELPVEEDTQEEELSFLAEEPASPEDESETGDSEDSSVDEIEFTVPGEIATAAFLSDDKESSEDVIEFEVPGEDDSDEIALDITEKADENEEELVIFEAVGEDVEVDPLPGEEYADNTVESDEDETLEFSAADEVDSQADTFVANSFESVSVDYSSLSNTIKHLKEKTTNSNLQALFAETNIARTKSTSNTTGKIFLQLLSTISQHIERNMDEPKSGSLVLMDDVYSGLQMSCSADISGEQIQQQLLACTSQVILLQQQDIVKAAASNAAPSSVDDENVVSIVQNELTDIKELFLNEIKMLRKEIIDK